MPHFKSVLLYLFYWVKGKVVPPHDMKEYRGSRSYSSHIINLKTRWR